MRWQREDSEALSEVRELILGECPSAEQSAFQAVDAVPSVCSGPCCLGQCMGLKHRTGGPGGRGLRACLDKCCIVPHPAAVCHVHSSSCATWPCHQTASSHIVLQHKADRWGGEGGPSLHRPCTDPARC